MLQREKENLKKELEDCSKQNSEFRKRTLSYKNKCDGYEEEINNLKIECSEKEEQMSSLRQELNMTKEKLQKVDSLYEIQGMIEKFNTENDETSYIIDDLYNRKNGILDVKLFAYKLQFDYSNLREENMKLKEENKQIKEELNEMKDICNPPVRKKKSIASYGALMIQEMSKEKIVENKLKKETPKESQVIIEDMIELEIEDHSKNQTATNKANFNNKSEITLINNPICKQTTAVQQASKLLSNIPKNTMSSTGKQNKLISLLSKQMTTK